MTAGHPPAGGVPLGRYSVAASATPSSIGSGTSSWEAHVWHTAERGVAWAGAPPSVRQRIAVRRRNVVRKPEPEYSNRLRFYNRAHGLAADRGLRLRRGRIDSPARVPRDDAARGFPVPRRPRPAAVRPAAAGGAPALRL